MEKIESVSVQELNGWEDLSQLDTDLLLSGNLRLERPLFQDPSRMDAFAVIFCVNGEAELQVNLKKYTLKSGTLALNLPENIIQISASENFTFYPFIISSNFIQRIHFKTKDLMELYMAVRSMPVFEIEYSDIHILEKYYHLLKAVLQSDDSGKDNIAEGIVTSFLHVIFGILKRRLEQEKASGHARIPERCEIVFEEFIKEVNRYHGTERSLSFYADRLNLTPNYLSGRIKEYSGKTAIEWIEDAVILEAKTLLKHSKLSIQEIAYKLQFPTQTFFGKYFKRIAGMSPSQYRAS